MNILEIKHFSKDFTLHNLGKHISACRGISLNLKQGEFIGITGKSGSGKSTILKSIYRTYLPGGGEIWYDSERFGRINLFTADEREIIYLRKYEIGYISQFLKVIPRRTALDIVKKSVLEMGVSEDIAREEAISLLTHFDLSRELWDSYPVNFSGGEKLRLNIAAAMIKKPRLLLLDEPTASLDMESKKKVRVLIERLKNQGTTMLGIFHDLEFMEGLCDRTYEMNAPLGDAACLVEQAV